MRRGREVTDIDRAIADVRDGLPLRYIHSRAAYFSLFFSRIFFSRIFIDFYFTRAYFFNTQNKLTADRFIFHHVYTLFIQHHPI